MTDQRRYHPKVGKRERQARRNGHYGLGAIVVGALGCALFLFGIVVAGLRLVDWLGIVASAAAMVTGADVLTQSRADRFVDRVRDTRSRYRGARWN